MKKTIINTFTLAIIALLIACGGGGEAQKQDGEIAKNEVIIQSLKTDKNKIGQTFTMEGTLSASNGLFSVKNNQVSFGFRVGNETIVFPNFNFGKDNANSLWFPDDFTDTDVETYDKNKVKGSMNDRYRITFKLNDIEVESAPNVGGFLLEKYEERKAKGELKTTPRMSLVEFEKLPE